MFNQVDCLHTIISIESSILNYFRVAKFKFHLDVDDPKNVLGSFLAVERFLLASLSCSQSAKY